MEKILDLIKRNSAWIIPALISLLLLKPAIEEINTILLAVLFESLAISLSGVAAYVYTKIDFVRTYDSNALGYIFIGVHFCVGLTVLGVYIAQFSGA